MIANNLTNNLANKMHKIHKSWVNSIRKKYLDTPIMNEYLQFKENDNHFKWTELIKPNKVVSIIIFSSKPKNSYSIMGLCGKNTWEQRRFYESTGLGITKYEISPKYLINQGILPMYASINKDMNKYSAWFLKILFNAYSRNKKTDIKCLIIGYDFLETKNVIEKYGIDCTYMKYLGDDKGFNNYNKLLKGKINWKNT